MLIFKLGFALLPTTLSAIKHEYNLAQARKMWMGAHQALHYMDHFKLLSDKLSEVNGAIISYYSNGAENEWIVAFDIKLKGNWGAREDGFAFYILEQPYSSYMVPSTEDGVQPFVEQMLWNNGLCLYFTGDNKRELKFALGKKANSKKEKYAAQKCELESEIGELHVMVASKNQRVEIFTGLPNVGIQKLKKCGEIPSFVLPKGRLYLAMYAQSGPSSPFQVDVTHLTYSSDVENMNISYFASLGPSNVSHLFKRINLMRSSSQLADAKSEAAGKRGLNVTTLYSRQVTNLRRIDTSNHYLSLNLEQSEELLSYLDQQKELAKSQFAETLNAVKKWLDDSSQQLAAIADDTLSLAQELKRVDLQKLNDKIESAVTQFQQGLKRNAPTLEHFQHLTNHTNDNLKLIKLKQGELQSLPELIKNYLQQSSAQKHAGQRILLLSVLSFIGVIVIISLASVLMRVKLSQRRKIFE